MRAGVKQHAPLRLCMVSLSATTPCWLSPFAVSRSLLRDVGGVPGLVVVLGVGESTTVSSLRRRLLASPQASSSVSVPCNSSVSQLSIPAGFAWGGWSLVAAPAGLHRAWSSALSPAEASIAAGGSHGTVASRSLCSIRRIGSPPHVRCPTLQQLQGLHGQRYLVPDQGGHKLLELALGP